jgi:thiol-disulfide isomerase/thioredoxin
MPSSSKPVALAVLALSLCAATMHAALRAQEHPNLTQPAPGLKSAANKPSAARQQISGDEELQQAIDNAGNDRAALVRNLEAFLKKYPEAQQRVKIYRALVETNLQLRDTTRAAEYAERIVALTPEDMSMTLLAIQLLERGGDERELRRATSYATRVLDFLDHGSSQEKSPKISKEEWEAEKKRDRMTILLLRGRLYLKLHQTAEAQKDFEASYALISNPSAAEKLGEIAELNKQLPVAIDEYARAFALADGSKGSPDRHEIRQKLGNVWRIAHGSSDGLGEYLLRIFDEVTGTSKHPQASRNAAAKEPYEFTLRRIPDGSPYPLADHKGKILVVSFWATWCGPCRALEPQFDRVAAGFQQNRDVSFLAANCDEDETLVPPYVQDMQPRTTLVFADGLDRLFAINSFPTVVVVDRGGKIVYRAEGYGEDDFEQTLAAAVNHALAPGGAAPAAASSRHQNQEAPRWRTPVP